MKKKIKNYFHILSSSFFILLVLLEFSSWAEEEEEAALRRRYHLERKPAQPVWGWAEVGRWRAQALWDAAGCVAVQSDVVGGRCCLPAAADGGGGGDDADQNYFDLDVDDGDDDADDDDVVVPDCPTASEAPSHPLVANASSVWSGCNK